MDPDHWQEHLDDDVKEEETREGLKDSSRDELITRLALRAGK